MNKTFNENQKRRVGKNIKKRLIDLEKTYAWLASELGVSEGYVKKVANGRKAISKTQVERIAAALNCKLV